MKKRKMRWTCEHNRKDKTRNEDMHNQILEA